MVDLTGKLAVLKAHFKIILTYRGMMLIHAIRIILLPLVLASAWLSIEKTASNPYSNGDYLLYYLLVPVVLNLTDSRIIFKFPMAVRDGSLNRELLKPFPPLLNFALESMANNMVQLIYLIPFTLLTTFFIYDRLEPGIFTSGAVALFMAAIAAGYIMRMLVSGSVALLGFWIEDVTTLNLIINGGVWALLGGMIVPVATFPDQIRKIAELLPYRYMLSFPIEILSGKLSGIEIGKGFLVVAVWAALTSILARFIWKAGLKNYSAYGG